jgi:hypothetical protein
MKMGRAYVLEEHFGNVEEECYNAMEEGVGRATRQITKNPTLPARDEDGWGLE